MVSGLADPLERGTSARLTIMRARFCRDSDGNLVALIDAAHVAHDMAVDRAFLQGIIDGSGDVVSESTFPRMEPMFAKYAEGSDTYALLERAANAFADAVQDAWYWAMAGWAIDEARRGHQDW